MAHSQSTDLAVWRVGCHLLSQALHASRNGGNLCSIRLGKAEMHQQFGASVFRGLCLWQEQDQEALFKCLRRILEHAKHFGGTLFSLAASVMTDLIHHDPLVFPSLDQAGLPQAFVESVKVKHVTAKSLVSRMVALNPKTQETHKGWQEIMWLVAFC